MKKELGEAIEALIGFRRIFLRCAVIQGDVKLWLTSSWRPPEHVVDVFGTLKIMWIGPECQCFFSPVMGETASWSIRDIRSLDDYERRLFETWSRNDGYSPDKMGKPAEWVIVNGQDGGLESHASQTEKKLIPLLRLAELKELAQAAIRVIRNGHPKWTPCQVEWSYLEEVDKVIQDLELELAAAEEQKEEKSDEGIPPLTLTEDQVKVLDYLCQEHPTIRYQADIGAIFTEGRDRNTLRKMLDEMMEIGLVSRPENKAKGYVITPSGKDFHEKNYA